MEDVLKAKGLLKADQTGNSQLAAEKKAKAETALREAIALRVLDAVEHPDMFEGDAVRDPRAWLLPEIAAVWGLQLGSDQQKRMDRLMGWSPVQQPFYAGGREEMAKRIAELSEPRRARLLTALCIVGEIHVGPNSTAKAERLMAYAERFEIDIAAVKKDLLPKKAAALAKKPAAAKKATKGKSAAGTKDSNPAPVKAVQQEPSTPAAAAQPPAERTPQIGETWHFKPGLDNHITRSSKGGVVTGVSSFGIVSLLLGPNRRAAVSPDVIEFFAPAPAARADQQEAVL